MPFRLPRAAWAAAVILVTVTSAAPAAHAGPSLTSISDVTRISGADRYEVAAKISEQMPPKPGPVVFITTGETFPDALSAGPATMSWGAHLLIVNRDRIPASVASHLAALSPTAVMIIGGRMSVSDDVVSAIASLVPGATIRRVDGADRYEVSRNVFTELSVPRDNYDFHIATGSNFPDALSAGAAAGLGWNPVLLVRGNEPTIDADTLKAMNFSAARATVVGGQSSVSSGIEADLAVRVPTARAGGADRYATSLSLIRRTFSSSDYAYVASGANFPDALTGSVLAATKRAPLYIVPPGCVPQGVLDDFSRLGVKHVVLVGGTASLSDAVLRLQAC